MNVLNNLRKHYDALLEPLTDADRALLDQLSNVRGDDFDLPGSTDTTRDARGSRKADGHPGNDLQTPAGG